MNLVYCLRSVLLLTTLQLVACAQPAHKNTWYSFKDSEIVEVNIYSPDNYELEGFILDGKGLEQQIESLVKIQGINSMVIITKTDSSLFDQAYAVHIAEKNGLKAYRQGLYWAEEISSAEILNEMDQDYKLFFVAKLIDL